jgi:hypothetical protein
MLNFFPEKYGNQVGDGGVAEIFDKLEPETEPHKNRRAPQRRFLQQNIT